MFKSLDEIKAMDKANGGNWFSPETMRFFNSRISSKVYPVSDGAYFVTSEQFSPEIGRFYTIRFASDRGGIGSADLYMNHRRLSDAHREAARLQEGHEPIGRFSIGDVVTYSSAEDGELTAGEVEDISYESCLLSVTDGRYPLMAERWIHASSVTLAHNAKRI